MGIYSKPNYGQTMQLIDLHADTITSLYYQQGQSVKNQEFVLAEPFANLTSNQLAIDLDKLEQADSLAQFFVLWLNLKACQEYKISSWEHFVKLHSELCKQIDHNSARINLVKNYAELMTAKQANKIGAFTCVEEGGFIESLDQLSEAFEMGVRYITLVWNYETHIGVPSAINQSLGLKQFGMEMVEIMQHLGMMVDVSHLSDQGVRDVLTIAKNPIIASHSNARSLCNHSRNLSDELIRGIADNGGVIGVNCVPYFLSETDKTIRLAQVIAHIKHIYQVGGEDVLAIGSDFDGFAGTTPELDEIRTIADMPKLIGKLSQAGFTEHQIEKLFNSNVLRVLMSTIK